jgi:hypothetical protein
MAKQIGIHLVYCKDNAVNCFGLRDVNTISFLIVKPSWIQQELNLAVLMKPHVINNKYLCIITVYAARSYKLILTIASTCHSTQSDGRASFRDTGDDVCFVLVLRLQLVL